MENNNFNNSDIVNEMVQNTKIGAQNNFSVVDGDKQVTSIQQLQAYGQGSIVELPPFGPGQPFVVRMRRPSLMVLVKSGKIPNALLSQATSLFVNGSNAIDGKNVDITELMQILDVIADSALLEPTYSQIKEAGLELSDDQLSAIFTYTQAGVRALSSFRTE